MWTVDVTVLNQTNHITCRIHDTSPLSKVTKNCQHGTKEEGMNSTRKVERYMKTEKRMNKRLSGDRERKRKIER